MLHLFSATPDPLFDKSFELHVYLLLSHDYLKKIKMDIIELLNQLADRRWHYPCRQCRILKFYVHAPNETDFNDYSCIVDDIFAVDTCSNQAERLGKVRLDQ